MSQPTPTRDEIARIAEEIYANTIRAEAETEENIGKMMSIDIKSGDYEIDDDPIVAWRRLMERHPDALAYGKRVGYDAAYALGGTLTRTAP